MPTAAEVNRENDLAEKIDRLEAKKRARGLTDRVEYRGGDLAAGLSQGGPTLGLVGNLSRFDSPFAKSLRVLN